MRRLVWCAVVVLLGCGDDAGAPEGVAGGDDVGDAEGPPGDGSAAPADLGAWDSAPEQDGAAISDAGAGGASDGDTGATLPDSDLADGEAADTPTGDDAGDAPGDSAGDAPGGDALGDALGDVGGSEDASDATEATDAGGDTAAPPEATLNEVQCSGDDWIELAAAPGVDLGGLRLSDAPGDASKTWTLPAGSVTSEEGLLLVPGGAGGLPFGIKCGDDTIWLLGPDGSTLDQVAVPVLPDGATLGRLPDGAGPWTETSPTPGALNEPLVDLQAVLYDPMRVAEVDLWVDAAGLKALWQDPYTYVDGRIRVTLDGYTSPVLDVGVRLKGRIGSFRTLNEKAAFKVKFNHKVKGTKWIGLKKLTLNNMVQDTSMVHEVLSYALMREVGLPASRTGYAWVRLNNRDYGLYLNLETYDDVFTAKHFPSTQHLYEGGYGLDVTPGAAPQFDLDEGDATDLSDLEALIAAAAKPAGQAWLDAVGAVADLDELRLLWAAEIYTGHWDGYAPTINNYYLHSDADGRFAMLTSGTDQTFGSHLDFHGGNGLLFKRCMETWPCRQAYDQQMATLVAAVPPLHLGAYAKSVAAFLKPWVEADPRKPYSTAQVASAVQGTVDFLAKRQADASNTFSCLVSGSPDPDGDGYPCTSDCDNGDPSIHPGAEDLCGDGVDQDCSGVADDGAGCPDWTEVYWGATRYLVCTTPRSWQAGREHCQALGADLVSIETVQERDWLRTNAPGVASNSHWIGLSDLATEGVFVWVNGTTPGFWGFAGGEPNDWGGNEDCTEMYANGAWNDLDCAVPRRLICEEAPGAPKAAPLAAPLAACVPDCAAKLCGDDGCGGSCGACPDGASCDGGACVMPLPSCAGACGGQSPDGCWCDDACTGYGDCCPDYAALCAAGPPPASCEGACGGQSPAGCWCDNACTGYGDCCPDYAAICKNADPTCKSQCGGMSPGGCYCDALCASLHDCCDDKGAECGGCGCKGKECGDDGCGASCGDCADGNACASGSCVPVPAEGCTPLEGAGCDGCPCEACVCEADVFCCYIAWDAACASRCATECAALSGCAGP
ncbi:MAG: hypothetical protein AMXMBFR64_30580 [Myxococcales bacterium]